MKIFMKFIVSIMLLSIWNISLAVAETPEEKGLRLAIEGDLTGQGFKDTLSQSKMTLRNA
ncbi:MAG: outer membrane lipoprotein-sorting protein, partial [Pelagibacterales bacterium]|nr:outer membrane lipoprotein-sorting protein [Pelagibacterales bacterium]